MGIYVFDSWKFLRDLLIKDAADPNSSHDFGGDLIPDIVKNGKAMAHRFDESCVRAAPDAPAYWRDVGTVDAFWKANIDLTDFTPDLDLWDRHWPIWTYSESVPPAKFVHDEEDRRGSACPVSCPAAASSRVPRCAIRCCSPAFIPIPTRCSITRWCCPMRTIERSARLTNVVIDRGVVIPKASSSARTRKRTPNGSASAKRCHADHPGHAGPESRRMRQCPVGGVGMRAAGQDRRTGRRRRRAARRAGAEGWQIAHAAAGLSGGDEGAR
jgi:ADP-glucose pyrophosphorylase